MNPTDDKPKDENSSRPRICYPLKRKTEERKRVLERRDELFPPGSEKRKKIEEDSPEFHKHDEIGLALSGGGIRSATFCLGVLQRLPATMLNLNKRIAA